MIRVKLATKLEAAFNHLQKSHQVIFPTQIQIQIKVKDLHHLHLHPPHHHHRLHLRHHQHDHLLDHELADVDKVASLNQHWVPFSWSNWGHRHYSSLFIIIHHYSSLSSSSDYCYHCSPSETTLSSSQHRLRKPASSLPSEG